MTDFQIGDKVRVIKTGEVGEIIGKGSLALRRPDGTVWNVAFPNRGSVNMLPEEIEPIG